MQAFRQDWARLSLENLINSKGVEFNSCCIASINLIFSRVRRGGGQGYRRHTLSEKFEI